MGRRPQPLHAVAAVLAGVVATVLNFFLVFEGSVIVGGAIGAVLFGGVGWIFGRRWSGPGWRWGLWISLPMWVVFVLLTIVGAGDWSDQVLRTVPPIVAVLFSSLAAARAARLNAKAGARSATPDGA